MRQNFVSPTDTELEKQIKGNLSVDISNLEVQEQEDERVPVGPGQRHHEILQCCGAFAGPGVGARGDVLVHQSSRDERVAQLLEKRLEKAADDRKFLVAQGRESVAFQSSHEPILFLMQRENENS
jgi:hypothetical protein